MNDTDLKNNLKNRCPWANHDEEMTKYHDEVWGVPLYDDEMLFAKLSLDLMQAGLSWRTILHKQKNFEQAFDNFGIKIVSTYDETKINQLLNNAGIVRNRLKISSIINNANQVIKIQEKFGSFSKYLWSFTKGEIIKNKYAQIPPSSPLSDIISADLKKNGFKFVGTTIIYAFLQAVGIIDDHLPSCFRY